MLQSSFILITKKKKNDSHPHTKKKKDKKLLKGFKTAHKLTHHWLILLKRIIVAWFLFIKLLQKKGKKLGKRFARPGNL